MASKINIERREQVDYTLDIQRGKTGEAQVSATVVVDDWEDGWMGRGPQIGAAHPEWGYLRLERISMRRQAGGMVKITYTYENARDEEANAGNELGIEEEPEYSIDYSCSEQPLLSHPKLEGKFSEEEQDALLILQNGGKMDDYVGERSKNRKVRDVLKDCAAAVTTVELLREGVVSYMCPQATYSVTQTVRTVELAGMGKIGSPPEAPATGGRYNWLLYGLNAHRKGNEAWRVSRSWMLSGPKGWHEGLYGNS